MDVVIEIQNGRFSWDQSVEDLDTIVDSVPSDDEKNQGLYDVSIKIREVKCASLVYV